MAGGCLPVCLLHGQTVSQGYFLILRLWDSDTIGQSLGCGQMPQFPYLQNVGSSLGTLVRLLDDSSLLQAHCGSGSVLGVLETGSHMV
jgi:hypothetical protein